MHVSPKKKRENVGLFWENVGLFWENVGLFWVYLKIYVYIYMHPSPKKQSPPCTIYRDVSWAATGVRACVCVCVHVRIHMNGFSAGIWRYTCISTCIHLQNSKTLFCTIYRDASWAAGGFFVCVCIHACFLFSFTCVYYKPSMLNLTWCIVQHALQHTATHCNTLQHTAICNILQRTATHCSTLQHTATHCR